MRRQLVLGKLGFQGLIRLHHFRHYYSAGWGDGSGKPLSPRALEMFYRFLEFAVFTGDTKPSVFLIPLSEHWDMFRKRLEKPPERRLELIGEINVGDLQEIGRSHSTPLELTVEPRPEDRNPAHAEIPQKITRGLATKL